MMIETLLVGGIFLLGIMNRDKDNECLYRLREQYEQNLVR